YVAFSSGASNLVPGDANLAFDVFAFVSGSKVSIAENTTAIIALTATDPDPAQTLAYSINGGADASKFAINSTTGALSFVTAPNLEGPTDVGGNNVYDVILQVSDGYGGIDTQAIAVTVTDAVENSIGNDLDNEIGGSGGNDVLLGYAGNDVLFGGAGNDVL